VPLDAEAGQLLVSWHIPCGFLAGIAPRSSIKRVQALKFAMPDYQVNLIRCSEPKFKGLRLKYQSH